MLSLEINFLLTVHYTVSVLARKQSLSHNHSDYTKCVLFAELAGAKMSDSKVPDGLIKDSNSGEVKAGPSNVDGVNSDSVKPTGKMG